MTLKIRMFICVHNLMQPVTISETKENPESGEISIDVQLLEVGGNLLL